MPNHPVNCLIYDLPLGDIMVGAVLEDSHNHDHILRFEGKAILLLMILIPPIGIIEIPMGYMSTICYAIKFRK